MLFLLEAEFPSRAAECFTPSHFPLRGPINHILHYMAQWFEDFQIAIVEQRGKRVIQFFFSPFVTGRGSEGGGALEGESALSSV